MHSLARSRTWAAVLLLLAACSDSSPAPTKPAKPADEVPTDPGTKVSLSLTAADSDTLSELDSALSEVDTLDGPALARRHPISFQSDLGYDPRSAHGLDLIQSSSLRLTDGALEKLGTQGFAISPGTKFPTMLGGYEAIYANDLPVYVSVDAILDAVHISYDDMLKSVEDSLLAPDMKLLLNGARTKLSAGVVEDKATAQDLDVFFAVALGLFEGTAKDPVAGGSSELIQKLTKQALDAKGISNVKLFGVPRDVDFSQFTPRGHYNDSESLKRYFRAMMWLGRTDFRFIQTLANGDQVFHRHQFEAALALRDLVEGTGSGAFSRIDAVISEFVGEHDYMQLDQLSSLLSDLGADDLAATKSISDQKIAEVLIEKGYGAQRIASQVIFKDPSQLRKTFPLDRSFALLGQRYVVDSHVFSNVVYDRVNVKGKQLRTMPNPLDVAYAAFGNDAALPLLSEELDTYGYAPNLERMRKLVDAHGDEYWNENLYNSWLSAIRAASPVADSGETDLPSVAKTEAWSKRMLNTQLGSWAQLRHDTILYAKQSYTAGVACEFPDAYVDPYPEVFARLASFAKRGTALTEVLSADASSALIDRMKTYFAELESVSNILRDMAEQQQKGVPFNAAQMAFINDAVKTGSRPCGSPPQYTGWLARIVFSQFDAIDPTIADVHTDPGGDRSPKVLHVATGLPRLLVVTVNTCDGPKAYAGVAFAYHELVTGLERLTDQDWAKKAGTERDVSWLESILP